MGGTEPKKGSNFQRRMKRLSKDICRRVGGKAGGTHETAEDHKISGTGLCRQRGLQHPEHQLSFAGETVKDHDHQLPRSEGKSYLSMNLMRTLAQRGMKVALVDATCAAAW